MPLSRWLSVAAAAGLLAACGGGGDRADTEAQPAAREGRAHALSFGTGTPTDLPATRDDACRFLGWASFGPTDGEVDLLMSLGYGGWITHQLALPASAHRANWDAAHAAIKLDTPKEGAGLDQVWESFWMQAVNGEDQLRQRMAYALSQIFVISTLDGKVGSEPRAVAAWLDMLGSKGLGNYRELLEAVALHPLMGRYLSHLGNQKAELVSGRIPDQNFAREVMQLFSIGLVRLNPDGTPLLADGEPVETYTADDVAGLSHVFTGFSWACPGAPAEACFRNGSSGGESYGNRHFRPMVAYPQYHSTEAKSFLGVTIRAQATADPAASLRVALRTLSAHPNVGPFFGRQLIQRLVTSNPSPSYVRDVAAVFDDNGAGVRGDLKAVLRAVLTHPEARLRSESAGKLREPVLRLAAFLRAFPHASDSGRWRVGRTDDAGTSLGQTPLRAGSVFNFYRPGYVAAGTSGAAAGLVAPEMQLLNETSVAGWVNYMRGNLSRGVGQFNDRIDGTALNRRDLQRNWSTERALAGRPPELVRSITDKLTCGQAGDALRTEITNAVRSIAIPPLNASGTNRAAIAAARHNRVFSAVLLTLASPEFLVQK